MNENPTNDFYKNFFAVLAGVLFAILAAFIFKIILHRFLHFDPLNDLTSTDMKNNFILRLTIGGWLFISSLAGGWVCAMIAGKNDVSHIIISSLVVLALYFLLGGTEIFKQSSLASWAVLLAIPIGYFIGEWMGGKKSE